MLRLELDAMPDEIILNILFYLNAKESITISRVNHHLHGLANDKLGPISQFKSKEILKTTCKIFGPEVDITNHEGDIINRINKLLKFHPEKIHWDVRDVANNTSLHAAASRGYYNLVKIFLEHGANVNAINASERTPLQTAIYPLKETAIAIIKLLMKYGAEKQKITQKYGTNFHAGSVRLFKLIKAIDLQKNPNANPDELSNAWIAAETEFEARIAKAKGKI